MILLCLIETSKKTIRPNWRKVILHKLYLNPLNFISERIASIFFPPGSIMDGGGMQGSWWYDGLEFNKTEGINFCGKYPSL